MGAGEAGQIGELRDLDIFRFMLKKKILIASAKVSLVVGALLNLINQGEAIIQMDDVSWSHFGMNFLVPFCVAGYSAARNEMSKDET